MSKIAVIGAGITGVTTAYQLARAGHNVTVFDRHPYAAMETSFANGGQLSASNAEVWNSWGTVLKGMKWLFRPDAPLSVNPRPDWHKLSWMAEFVASIPNYEHNTTETVRMALRSRDVLKEIAAREQIDFDCEQRGILHFYRSKQAFDTATKVTGILAQGGLNREVLTADDVRRLEPTLHGPLYGGYLTRSDFTGDIHKFARGLLDVCGNLGVTLRLGFDVTALAAEQTTVHVTGRVVSDVSDAAETQSFDKIVICAGVASRRFAAMLGDRVNVYPVKGYSITVNLPTDADRSAAPWISLLDDDAKIVSSRLGADRFRVAGTAEFNGHNRDIRHDRVQPLIDWCRTHFPAMSTEHVTPWAGLRPMMPDMMPRVGPGRLASVYYNTGHGHLGWTLSAATAEAISACIGPGAGNENTPASRRAA